MQRFDALIAQRKRMQQYELRMALWTAWHVAALERAKRLPALKGMLAKLDVDERRPLTAAEKQARRAEFEALRERMGG